jgi:hypothetical protein
MTFKYYQPLYVITFPTPQLLQISAEKITGKFQNLFNFITFSL